VKVAAFGSEDQADRSATRKLLREQDIDAKEAAKEQQQKTSQNDKRKRMMSSHLKNMLK
jgi:hypothetical protein